MPVVDGGCHSGIFTTSWVLQNINQSSVKNYSSMCGERRKEAPVIEIIAIAHAEEDHLRTRWICLSRLYVRMLLTTSLDGAGREQKRISLHVKVWTCGQSQEQEINRRVKVH